VLQSAISSFPGVCTSLVDTSALTTSRRGELGVLDMTRNKMKKFIFWGKVTGTLQKCRIKQCPFNKGGYCGCETLYRQTTDFRPTGIVYACKLDLTDEEGIAWVEIEKLVTTD